MKANPISVGKRIRSKRKEKGLTMVKLGSMIDAPQSAISNWEKGDNLPNNERLVKLADIFDIAVDELLYGISITTKQVRNKLMHDSLEGILVEKLTQFLQDFDNNLFNFKLDIFKQQYFYRLYGRMKQTVYDEENSSTTSKERELVLDIARHILRDLTDELPNIEKDEYSPIFDVVTDLLNGKVKPSDFLDYLITICENIAKSNPVWLEFMLSYKIGQLINDINNFLKNPHYKGMFVMQNGAYTDPNAIIDSIDYGSYKEIQSKLMKVSSFINSNLIDDTF